MLLRRELQTPSCLVFLNFTKYLRKVFETPLNDHIWLAEYDKIYTPYFQERRQQQLLCKICVLESF